MTTAAAGILGAWAFASACAFSQTVSGAGLAVSIVIAVVVTCLLQ